MLSDRPTACRSPPVNRDSAKSRSPWRRGRSSRSTEECEMSRSCQSGDVFHRGSERMRPMRDQTVRFSVRTVDCVGAAGEEPLLARREIFLRLQHFGALQMADCVASRSTEEGDNAQPSRNTSHAGSRGMTWSTPARASSPAPWRHIPRPRGSILAIVPTAAEMRAMWRSLRVPAIARCRRVEFGIGERELGCRRVVGSAWMPWLRPYGDRVLVLERRWRFRASSSLSEIGEQGCRWRAPNWILKQVSSTSRRRHALVHEAACRGDGFGLGGVEKAITSCLVTLRSHPIWQTGLNVAALPFPRVLPLAWG